MGASITYCMVHLQASASLIPDTPMMVYGTGRWAHFNVKLHFYEIWPVRSGKVREKPHEKVRESQGISLELAAGNPAVCLKGV